MRKDITSRLAISCMILIWVSTAGCGFKTGSVESPRVMVSKIKVEDINLFEAVLRIEMRVFNGNSEAFDFKGLDCQLDLENSRLATGVSNMPIHIPPHGTAVIPITVYSSVEDMARIIREIRLKDKVVYQMNGKLFMDGGFFRPDKLAFQSQGEISLEGLKAFRMSSLQQ